MRSARVLLSMLPPLPPLLLLLLLYEMEQAQGARTSSSRSTADSGDYALLNVTAAAGRNRGDVAGAIGGLSFVVLGFIVFSFWVHLANKRQQQQAVVPE